MATWTSRRWPPPGPSCWRARLGGEGALSEKPRAYYHSVSDDLATKTANNSAYHSVSLRPRVSVDVRDVDTTSAICRGGISLPVFWALTRVARRACYSVLLVTLEDIMKTRLALASQRDFGCIYGAIRRCLKLCLRRLGGRV